MAQVRSECRGPLMQQLLHKPAAMCGSCCYHCEILWTRSAPDATFSTMADVALRHKPACPVMLLWRLCMHEGQIVQILRCYSAQALPMC